MIDWSEYKHFSKEEFDCKETGENRMRPEFMEVLQAIRETYGRPMIITSGYRSPQHSVEIRKDKAGEHTYGIAADIMVHPMHMMELCTVAYSYGVRRFGLSPERQFVHLGIGDRDLHFPQSTWTYK